MGGIFDYLYRVLRQFFKILARINKALLPSFTKRGMDLEKASKLQLALFAYRLWVTKNALDQ